IAKNEKIYVDTIKQYNNLKVKNNSNINKAHKYFINLLIYSNIKPKNKSEKYKIKANLTKFYNDKNETKKSKFYFDIQKKNTIRVRCW
ncbi:MAG: hypothetical protein IKS49_08570, partial [Actinomycetaceae bacterium]|nr:hypothetical protein [Actinomycetaceae bacterium]